MNQPTTIFESLRYLYAVRGWVAFYGAWVKVSVKRSAGDFVFASHRVGDGGDENFALLTATRKLWELLNEA